ncbi:hypothetical protein [Vibrio hepatarius]|uniref:hypothetical protein n=1 Tax=Vibrio hepatarius TaxID=171383 RepID=UPI001C0828A4|nr:hypothetical protein [Vibrio hepatarius]MBU2897047.1 hypothetical protein [Vibrio hepatarius]
MSSKLNESFNLGMHTSGAIDVRKIRVFDADLKPLASSTQGGAFGAEMVPQLKGLLGQRQGAEKLKSYTFFWNNKNQAHFSVVFPIGGLRAKGYGEIILNPIHNLKGIETLLNSSIQLTPNQGDVVYRSADWPDDLSLFSVAQYAVSNKAGDEVLSIRAAFDSSELINEMNMTRNIVLFGFSGLAGVFVVGSLAFLNRMLFQPLQDMVQDLEQVSKGNLKVEIH